VDIKNRYEDRGSRQKIKRKKKKGTRIEVRGRSQKRKNLARGSRPQVSKNKEAAWLENGVF
jgi:hypothetical protein